jgi:CheY-like chemotaxis protein
MMPGMSGWELADVLASSPRWADIPIIVVSASTAVKRPLRARAFLTKPVPVDRLIDATKHCQVHQSAAASECKCA